MYRYEPPSLGNSDRSNKEIPRTNRLRCIRVKQASSLDMLRSHTSPNNVRVPSAFMCWDGPWSERCSGIVALGLTHVLNALDRQTSMVHY